MAEVSACEKGTVISESGNDFYFWHMKGKSPGIFYIQTEDGKGNHAPTLETFCKQEGIRFVRVLLEGLEEDGISIREGIITDWLSGCQSVLKEVGLGSQVLVGHGIGGWLMFLLALREPDLVSGLVGLATLPDFPDLLWKGFSKEEKVEIKRKNYHTFERRGIKFRIPISVFPEASKYCILNMPGIEHIKVPVSLVHGEEDDLLGPSVSLELMQRIKAPTSYKVIEGGDHFLNRPEDLKVIIETVNQCLHPDHYDNSELDSDDES